MTRLASGPADYARACVGCYVAGRRAPQPPGAPFYERRAACFVTLKKYGELRGCIGTLEPAAASLGAEISRNARSSALHDPRFPPVGADEFDALTVSVDVLSPSLPCALADLDPARYGVIVQSAGRRGVLLPALDGIDTAEGQVAIALQKAGIRGDEAFDVARFTVVRYREGDPPRAEAAAAAEPEADA